MALALNSPRSWLSIKQRNQKTKNLLTCFHEFVFKVSTRRWRYVFQLVFLSLVNDKKLVFYAFLYIIIKSVCLSVCLSVSLSLSLSIYIYIYIYICFQSVAQYKTKVSSNKKIPWTSHQYHLIQSHNISVPSQLLFWIYLSVCFGNYSLGTVFVIKETHSSNIYEGEGLSSVGCQLLHLFDMSYPMASPRLFVKHENFKLSSKSASNLFVMQLR